MLLYSCSNFEFVYEKNRENEILKKLKKEMSYNVEGDDLIILKQLIAEEIGISNLMPKFKLDIKSTRSDMNIIKEKDQTASKIEINHQINYHLKSNIENCTIIKKRIDSKTTYDSKSSGYNFGSDLSKKEITKKNIEQNINKFFTTISNTLDDLKCNNEN